MVIAAYWKKDRVPSINERLNKCWSVMVMGKLTAIVQAKLGKEKAVELFKQDWTRFLIYWKEKEKAKNQNIYKLNLKMS